MEHKNVTKKILGFNAGFEDIRIEHLAYRKNLNIDKDYKVPIKKRTSNSTDITIMIDHDFVERYYEIKYFGWMDILSIIGGYNASIGPMLGIFVPLFILNYLVQLAKVIHLQNEENYVEELNKLSKDYKKVFKQVNLEECRDLDEKKKNFIMQFISTSDEESKKRSDEQIMKDLMHINRIT